MLPDLSPAHILIVVVAALIFIGPKDLPLFLRKIGQFMGKMRSMANEFRASFDEMARQSELDELRKEVEAMRASAQSGVASMGLNDPINLDTGESAYLSQWQASQDAAATAAAEVPKDGMMTSVEAKPAKASKAKALKPKAAEPTSKPVKAATKAAPAKTAKPAAPKPRAKKKAEAGS